jgi:hypothetical protein
MAAAHTASQEQAQLDAALRASIADAVLIEDRPKVKAMHDLVTITWPNKVAVNVDAQGDCLLESYLVATDDVGNIRDSIRSLREDLARFYVRKKKECEERVSQDGAEQKPLTVKERAEKIKQPHAYFDTIDIFMFELMTNTMINIYTMRQPKGAIAVLELVPATHGYIYDTVESPLDVPLGCIIDLCHHENNHFTPIVPIAHAQVHYNYHDHQNDIDPTTSPTDDAIDNESTTSISSIDDESDESNIDDFEHDQSDSEDEDDAPMSPRRSERLAKEKIFDGEPDYSHQTSPTKRKSKTKRKQVAIEDHAESESDDEDVSQSETITKAVKKKVEAAVKLKKLKVDPHQLDAIISAAIRQVLDSSSSASSSSSSSSSLSSSSSSSSSSSTSSTPARLPGLHSLTHATVDEKYNDDGYYALLAAMDDFETKYLNIAKSECTTISDDGSYTPLDMIGTIARISIPKRTKIGYFRGELVKKQEYDACKDTTFKINDHSMRVATVDDDIKLIVDYRCAAGYVNSTSPTQFPNTRYRGEKLRANVKLVKSKKWPGLFYYESIEKIKQGDELFALYYGEHIDSSLDDDEEAMRQDTVSDDDDVEKDETVNSQNVHDIH